MKNCSILEFVAFGEEISPKLKEALRHIYYGQGGKNATITALEKDRYEVNSKYIEPPIFTKEESSSRRGFDVYREQYCRTNRWKLDDEGRVFNFTTKKEVLNSREKAFE